VVLVLVVRTSGGRERSLGMSARHLGWLEEDRLPRHLASAFLTRTIGQGGFGKTRCTAKKSHFRRDIFDKSGRYVQWVKWFVYYQLSNRNR
jgi:hypothetical protein